MRYFISNKSGKKGKSKQFVILLIKVPLLSDQIMEKQLFNNYFKVKNLANKSKFNQILLTLQELLAVTLCCVSMSAAFGYENI